MTAPDDLVRALTPVRDALVADAHRAADTLLAAAEAAATASTTAAARTADEMLTTARAEGEAEARSVAADDLARAQRDARELVLAARRRAFERLLAEARAAASAVQGEPCYRQLLDGLAARARRQLGDDAVVSVDHEVGGLEARAGSRSVDYRLPVIADRCVGGLGEEVDALWR